MRLSCNGCRVLRKGCSDACTIRPCLQWIKANDDDDDDAPDAQADATLFLAKFYGRAGLLNLLNAAPAPAPAGDDDVTTRPGAVFRSLLYEACGRIVNPLYGAVGLLWSGNWHMCHAAVDAVLKGQPITTVAQLVPSSPPDDPGHDDAGHLHLHHKDLVNLNHKAAAAAAAAAAAYDIRHVFPKSSSSNKQAPGAAAAAPPPPLDKADSMLLHKVAKPGRAQFKRTAASSTSSPSKTKSPPPPKPHTVAVAVPALPDTDDDDGDDMVVAAVDHYEQEHAVRQASNGKNCHATSDRDHHSVSVSVSVSVSASASLDTDDTEEAASHVSQADQEPATAPVPAELQGEDQPQPQQAEPPLGIDLTLGPFLSAPPPPMTAACPRRPPTPVGCRQGGGSSAADQPGESVIGFRFL